MLKLLSATDLQAKIAQAEKDRVSAVNAAEAEKKEAEAFLKKMEGEKGAEKTASGLIYIPGKPGDGASPKATDVVKVNYHGTLRDGTVFDSSVERGEPVSFPVNGVIPGWTEALQLMKEGDKWQITLPSKIAYGEQGAGAKIGPNSVLIFDVELLSIEKAN